MNSTQQDKTRQGANSISEQLELRIRNGDLAEGDRLPSIRALAEELSVSPATVSAAYGKLRTRGLIVADRSGTVVAPLPDLPGRSAGLRQVEGIDLSDSNPDMRLLPDLGHITPSVHQLQYGEAENMTDLTEFVRTDLEADGVPGEHLVVVGGSHDGVERALAAHLRPGDRVALEDPGYASTQDLVRAMGLIAVPMAVDPEGPVPDAVRGALESGAKALVLTNRAQNPTGAALTAERAEELASVFDRFPDVLFIEDDHAGPVSGADFYTTVSPERDRWIVVRSFGKYLAPDLRVAVVAGDALTVGRISAKQLAGTGWVSQILQDLVLRGLSDPSCLEALDEAEVSYRERREALLNALEERGVAATGPSGFNVWIPVRRETEAWAALSQRGYVAAPGEQFSIESGPGLRITISQLDMEGIPDLADAIAASVT